MKHIIIDCDPGHDDFMAIYLALKNKKKLKVHAISTVAGNMDIETVTTNAMKTLKFLNEEIPIYKGNKKPLKRPLEVPTPDYLKLGVKNPMVHPSLGLGDLADYILKAQVSFDLVAIGPLTNIASLIRDYPGLIKKINSLTIMGGSLSGGNRTAYAEYNFYSDPEAAQMVLNAGIPLVLAGLEVCAYANFPYDLLQSLDQMGPEGQTIKNLLIHYNNLYGIDLKDGATLYDVCTVLYLLHPEIFTYESLSLDIACDDLKRGQCIQKDGQAVQYLKTMDSEIFIQTLIACIKKDSSQ